MKLGIKEWVFMRILSSIFDKFDIDKASENKKTFPMIIIHFLPS